MIVPNSAILLLTVLCSPAPSEEDRIRKVIDEYVVGWRESDPERLRKVFAVEDGYVIWVGGEAGSESVDSSSFAEILARGRRPRPDYGERFEITSLDVVDGKLAVAKVEIRFSGGTYVDVLVLYEVDDDWRIVTKTYVVRRAPG